MGGRSQEHDHECNLDSSECSSDDEKRDFDVPNINVEAQAANLDDDYLEETNQENLDCLAKNLEIVKQNLAEYENDCNSQSSSSTCDSTDNDNLRGTRRKPSKLPSREVLQRILELAEYYLSDENLVNDMFLLKHVTKHKEGFVSLKLLANYKKLKRVRKEWTVLAEALRESTNLELNEDGSKVRRVKKLPCELEEDTRLFRSVLGYAIPEHLANMERLAEIFSKFGEIDSIQLHKPGGRSFPEVHLVEKENPGTFNTLCCLIIYDKVHYARLALKHLTNSVDCPLKVMAIPRRKSSPDAKPEVAPTKEYESAYFSASDLEDPGSPFLFRSRNGQSAFPLGPAFNNNWRQRAFSPGSSSVTARSSRSSNWGTPSISSLSDDRCPSRHSMYSNSPLRLKYQNTPNSSPLPRRYIPIRPLVTPPDSPTPIRRFLPHVQAASAPCSPWVRRKLLTRHDAPTSSDTSSLQSPREASLPENVLRMPRGPDDTKGFRARIMVAVM